MAEHFVQFVLEPGDSWPTAVFTCTAPVGAKCRVFCKTCVDECQEQCVCEYLDEPRVPVIEDMGCCNYVAWMESGDGGCESFGGARGTPIIGPEPAPVVFTWEGDYFIWEYAA